MKAMAARATAPRSCTPPQRTARRTRRWASTTAGASARTSSAKSPRAWLRLGLSLGLRRRRSRFGAAEAVERAVADSAAERRAHAALLDGDHALDRVIALVLGDVA